jgi:hypothetical protein
MIVGTQIIWNGLAWLSGYRDTALGSIQGQLKNSDRWTDMISFLKDFRPEGNLDLAPGCDKQALRLW